MNTGEIRLKIFQIHRGRCELATSREEGVLNDRRL